MRKQFSKGAVNAILLAVISLFMITIVFPCKSKAASNDEFIIVAGGPTGGLFSIVAAGAAEILRKEFPKSVVDVVPGGAGPNLIQSEQKKISMGITFANNAFDAWNGRDPAKSDKPIRQVRAIMSLFPSAMQIWVHADSGINEFKELKQKKICPSSPGQAPWQAFHNLLDVYGISSAEISKSGGKIVQLTWSEAVAALSNKQLDSVAWLTLFPHSSMVEVEVNNPVRVLSLEREKLDEFLKRFGGGFSPVTIPAGTYKGQKDPALTVGTAGFLVVPAETSDDFVYRVVKTLYNNLDKLKASHSSMALLTKETIAKGMAIPLHPGAIKFYKENGITMSDPEVK